jgi:hypothetical protein
MLLDKIFFATIISLPQVISIDWKFLKSFILFYVCMLVADVTVSSSHDRKPSMSCILYPMMNFSPQHWQTVYIFKTKLVVDLVYLYRTNFQNVDTVVVSNNTTDTCSAHPPPILPPRGGHPSPWLAFCLATSRFHTSVSGFVPGRHNMSRRVDSQWMGALGILQREQGSRRGAFRVLYVMREILTVCGEGEAGDNACGVVHSVYCSILTILK